MGEKSTKETEAKVDGIGRLLDEAESGRSRPVKRKPSTDLDLDGAWNKS